MERRQKGVGYRAVPTRVGTIGIGIGVDFFSTITLSTQFKTPLELPSLVSHPIIGTPSKSLREAPGMQVARVASQKMIAHNPGNTILPLRKILCPQPATVQPQQSQNTKKDSFLHPSSSVPIHSLCPTRQERGRDRSPPKRLMASIGTFLE